MDILSEYVSFEESIKGSRFLSELFPCESQNQARELIKSQKAKYADATHVVHAFIIGTSAEIMGMSDDGEPSGTAGRPALDVLKGRKCTNLVLIVTRWFGGTLLGTGGLVKAYSGGAKQVIEKADSLGVFHQFVKKQDFCFTSDYSLYKIIKINLESFNIFDLHEEFGTDITISGKIQENEFSSLAEKLLNLSNGKIVL